jgi:hypothetical protein
MHYFWNKNMCSIYFDTFIKLSGLAHFREKQTKTPWKHSFPTYNFQRVSPLPGSDLHGAPSKKDHSVRGADLQTEREAKPKRWPENYTMGLKTVQSPKCPPIRSYEGTGFTSEVHLGVSGFLLMAQ